MNTERFVRFAAEALQATEKVPEESVLTNEMIAVMVILGGTVVLISFIVTTVIAIIYKRKRAFMRGDSIGKRRKR